jgi:membrane protease YdiL (CAAX protease family)
MTTATTPIGAPVTGPSSSGIAPAWHTVIVLCMMLGLSLVGAFFNLQTILGVHGRVISYLLVMVTEWATVGFIWWGLNRQGVRMADVVGGSWARGIHVLRDCGIGIAFVVIFGGAVQVLGNLLKVPQPQAMLQMLPQTWYEMIIWVLISLTAGFCEEMIFRGYLQRQFSVLTRSVVGGILLQGVVFGLSHGYQGWKLMSLIALYGALFGVLAHWRRSLRPGMIGHALQDTAGGLLAGLQGH